MNATDAEKLLLAMISAYVWVASSDEGVDLDEYNKFNNVIVESPFATHFTALDIRHTFKDMVGVFAENYDFGIQLTRDRLKEYANDPMKAEEILRLARAAMVGDNRLEEVEENVLHEVARELNLNINEA